MKANYSIEAGDVRVIRPLVYVREKSTRDFSIDAHLPVINENCPACFEEPKVRFWITSYVCVAIHQKNSLFS
jgi:tRNA(Ile)-lysidine synthase TilS/MesJ